MCIRLSLPLSLYLSISLSLYRIPSCPSSSSSLPRYLCVVVSHHADEGINSTGKPTIAKCPLPLTIGHGRPSGIGEMVEGGVVYNLNVPRARSVTRAVIATAAVPRGG